MFTLEQVIPNTLKHRGTYNTSAIWNHTFEFLPTSFIKVMAPSGTGKTTLIHLLYGLRKDFIGKILFNNKNILDLSGNELAYNRQQHWSVIFQDLRLFANLSARENIELNRLLQEPYYSTTIIDEMAAELGISHILHQPAYQCSYGEQQRIAIIRALVQPFTFLLMDEPFSHLDNANKKIAAALIQRECIKRNAGLLIADLEEDILFPYHNILLL